MILRMRVGKFVYNFLKKICGQITTTKIILVLQRREIMHRLRKYF